MDYTVLVVEDDQLPPATDWVIARADGDAYFMVKRCRLSIEGGVCELLEEAWSVAGNARAVGRLDVAV